MIQRPSQQLIADHLEISRTTVSRCFTNHKGINPKTRADVFALSAKLGYQYLEPRSRKKNDKQLAIGVLICGSPLDYTGEYESPAVELLRGISEFALLNKLRPEIHFVPPEACSVGDPCYGKIMALKKRKWAGIILIFPFPLRIIQELVNYFPCVSLIQQYGGIIDCVDVNHHKGISMMMDCLRQNARKVGFFSRRYPVEATWSYRRFSAYVENLVRSGLEYDERNVIMLDISDPKRMTHGYNLIMERINQGVRGWLCAADHQAYDLIGVLKKKGYRIPEDVSISGFDGIQGPKGAPALDTVKIPYYEIGFSGSRRLLEKINKRFDTVHEILLDCRRQEGETILMKR